MEGGCLEMQNRYNIYDIFIHIALFIFVLVCVYPFYFVIIGSFSNGNLFNGGGVWILPKGFTLSNYKVILSDTLIWYAFRNTIIKTLFGTTVSLLFTSLVAYAMHHRDLKYKKIFQSLNLFTMFFSGGLIPYFVLINYLGLYDSFLVYIIPSLYSVYNMIIISSFYQTIPKELYEAAILDGAGEMTVWWKIYMPLSKPVLATVALWLSVGHWNSYFSTMIYTTGGKKVITLQYYLMNVINKAAYTIGDFVPPGVVEEVVPATVSYAAIVVAVLPLLFIYPFLQRFFTKGIAIGSLKG